MIIVALEGVIPVADPGGAPGAPPPIQPDNFISFWVPLLNVLLNKKKLNTKIYIFAT